MSPGVKLFGACRDVRTSRKHGNNPALPLSFLLKKSDLISIIGNNYKRRYGETAFDCTATIVMIQLHITKEADLYSPYDPSQTRINDRVYHYLKSFCTRLEYEKHLHDTLQIVTDSPIDEEKFRTALHDAVRRDRDEFDRQITENNRRVLWEWIVGILLSVLGVALSLWKDQVLLALISFLGTTAIGNALTIQTTVNHDVKQLKKLLDPFLSFRLEVMQAGEASEAGPTPRRDVGDK